MKSLLNMQGMTPREYFRIHGTLPDSTIDELIEVYEAFYDAPIPEDEAV